MRFDFNEINILKQNFYETTQKKNDLLELLRTIHEKTEDYILKDSVQSLIGKVSALSQEDLLNLRNDIMQKKLVATMNNPTPVDFSRLR